MPTRGERKVEDLGGASEGNAGRAPGERSDRRLAQCPPAPPHRGARAGVSLLLGRALGLGFRRAEEAREEGLHAAPEGHGAITYVVPGVLRLGLRAVAGFLDLVARHLGAADHRLAHALCSVRYPTPDLLAAALDLLGAFLDLGVVGCRGRSRSE